MTTEEGVYAIEAEQFVDATGDAVLSRMAGVAYTAGDENGNNQMTSLRFEMGGIDVRKYRAYCLSLNDEFSPLVKGLFESTMVRIRILNLNRFFSKRGGTWISEKRKISFTTSVFPFQISRVV